MADRIILTRTFSETNAKTLDSKVNPWLKKMQEWASMYDFKLISLKKFYEDGNHIVNVIFEIDPIWASSAMR